MMLCAGIRLPVWDAACPLPDAAGLGAAARPAAAAGAPAAARTGPFASPPLGLLAAPPFEQPASSRVPPTDIAAAQARIVPRSPPRRARAFVVSVMRVRCGPA